MRISASRSILWGTIFLAVSLASISQMSVAMAQEAGQEEFVIEEVIVTARKREESLQEVPISVSVTTGEIISQQNYTSLHELSSSLPGVTVAEGGSTDRLFIRGVGSGDFPMFEQSVGIFVDGIYHGRARLGRATFLDIERIEVLKGPQSTYFGNNTIAGALNIITKQPDTRFDGYVRALYEPSAKEYVLETAIGGGITDSVTARAAIRFSGMDGYLEDLTAGGNVPDRNDKAGRLTVKWTPNEAFDATFKVEMGEEKNTGALPQQLVNCPPSAPFPAPGPFCGIALAAGAETELNDQRSLSPGQFAKLSWGEYVLTMNYDLSRHTLTSITGFSNFDFKTGLDIDGTPQQLLNVFNPEDYEQVSQEFRFASSNQGRFEYMAGLYFQDGDLDISNEFGFLFLTPIISSIPPFAPLVPFLPFGVATAVEQDDKTISAFGSLTWNITDALRTTVGLRWTKVEKDFRRSTIFGTPMGYFGPVQPLPANIAPLAQAFAIGAGLGTAGELMLSRKDDDVTPSISLQYDASDDMMIYFSYTDGFKAGGFNAGDTTNDPANILFKPESVDAYEFGIKSRWPDGNITANIAIFRNEYKDLQVAVSQLQGPRIVGTVSNAGASISQGVEAELGWAANERLRLGLAFIYLDSFYKEYLEAGSTAAQSLAGFINQDLSDQATMNAPDYSGSFTADYTYPLSNRLELTAGLNVFFSDEYFVGSDNDPNLLQEAYTKIDARVSIGSQDGTWDISLIGKNLTDEKIATFGTDQPVAPGSYIIGIERFRNISIQVRYSW